MKTGIIVLIVVLAILGILVLWGISAYNNFVVLEQDINGKWSEVENQYQRQADLIPNLVSVVSSSVSVETKFVKDVIAARTNFNSAQGQLGRDTAGVQMANGLAALVSAVAENYPILQANKQYIALTDELAGTQNRITVARGNYIKSIQTYNTAVIRFPGMIFAKIFGFTSKQYYQADVSAMTTPTLGTGQLPG